MPLTVIYADTVFFMNGVLDYLLLLSAARLAAAPFRRLRLILAAALGGVYAVTVFLPQLRFLNHALCRILMGLIMTAIAFGTGRGYIRLTAVFFAVSVALAGALMAVSLLDTGQVSFPRGIPVTAMDGKSLLLAGAICCWICSALMHRLIPEVGGELVAVKLSWQGREAGVTALLDSGNLLTDSAGNSVLITDPEAVRGLLPKEPRLTPALLSDPVSAISYLTSQWGTGRLSLLPYRSVGQRAGMLLALRIDSAIIGTKPVSGLTIALAPEPVSSSRYQAIIGTSDYSREDNYGTNLHFHHPSASASPQGKADHPF